MDQLRAEHFAVSHAGQDDPGTGPEQPTLVAPLACLGLVGIVALGLLYLGARDWVVPILFLSLPFVTCWLIMTARRNQM